MTEADSHRSSRRCSKNSRTGSQKPTYRYANSYDMTWGPLAAKLGDLVGYELDKWQRDVLSDWLAYDRDKRYVHQRNGLEIPRQNGKTFVVELRIIIGVVFFGERILYTAHDFSTVTQLFDRMKHFFGDKANDEFAAFPELNEQVEKTRLATGKEAIFFKNGAAIFFSTRTNSTKRGFTVDVIIADEAQELTDTQLKAILSTASAAPLGNPQYIFVGTPPGPLTSGDVFAHVRDDVISNAPSDISWNEWSVSSCDPATLSDVATWYLTNPALGLRISEDTVRAEFGTYTDVVSFAQERLGYWLPAAMLEKLIDADRWKSLESRGPLDSEIDKIAYGVKFSPDGRYISLSVAAMAGGSVHVELVENRQTFDGVQWLVDWLFERKEKAAVIVIDGKSSAGDVAERLERLKVPKRQVVLPKASDVADASAMFVNAVNEMSVTHFGNDLLDSSAVNATKRRIGSGGGYGFDGEMPSPIESCALAYWGVRTTKRNPKRKVKVL